MIKVNKGAGLYIWPLLRRSEPLPSSQISLALCSEWHPQQLRCEDSAVFRPYLCGPEGRCTLVLVAAVRKSGL